MKKYLLISLFFFCSIIYGQETGDLRFNNDKEGIEIYIDEIISQSYEYDTLDVYRIKETKMKGWYSLDSLYEKHGSRLEYYMGNIGLGYIIGEQERFDSYIQEWFHKNLERTNPINYSDLFLSTEPYLKPLTQNETLKIDLLTILLETLEEYEKECYADSSLQCYNLYRVGWYNDRDTGYTPCSEYDFDLAASSSYIGRKEIWVHKPATFEGFREFLYKKIKRE